MFGLEETIDVPNSPPASLNGGLGMATVEVPASCIDWVKAMETLRVENGWSDVELSNRIHLSKSMINQCRNGIRPLPPAARIRVLSGLGFEITRDRLLSAVHDEVRAAVLEADAASAFVRSALVDRFLDDLDEIGCDSRMPSEFLAGLAKLSGKGLYELGASLSLNSAEVDQICNGRLRIPFRSKRAITERFGGNELGALILSISNRS